MVLVDASLEECHQSTIGKHIAPTLWETHYYSDTLYILANYADYVPKNVQFPSESPHHLYTAAGE
jgi:hypothetical protein